MSIFVRKNVLTIVVAFTAADGTATQPSAANCILNYKDPQGATHTNSIPLAFDVTTNQWTGVWDTTASGEGLVNWVAYGYGTLQAATQGCFEIVANAANIN
jgi:hypothetical protein